MGMNDLAMVPSRANDVTNYEGKYDEREEKLPNSEEYTLAELTKRGAKEARASGRKWVQIGASDFHQDPETFEQLFAGIQDELFELMVKKQRDYGVGNIAKFGLYGVLVRTSDKLERLQNLVESGRAPSNESLEDTAKDIANYGMIMLAVMREQWGLPLREDLEDDEPESLREY